MASYPPKGLIIALVTPFDEKGKIDWPSLNRLVERLLPFADGLLVGEGQVGEGLSLTNPLRRELLRGTIQIVGGKKPLFLCPTALTEEETLQNAEAIGNEGLRRAARESLFWVDMPLWYHSNRKLPQLYEEWKKRTPFPILLYNQPQVVSQLGRTLKRRNIRTGLLKRLSENDQIVGLIFAGDLARAMDYQRAVRLRRDFLFYDEDERNFLNQPSSSGVVSGGANLLPAEWKEIVDASLKLTEDPARNLLVLRQSQKLRELHRVLRAAPAAHLKWALQRLGIIRHPKVWGKKGSASGGGDGEMGRFLRENFSLQSLC
jgi:dihydrodipicolinate synthase/N-acetylneuraminate lyase